MRAGRLPNLGLLWVGACIAGAGIFTYGYLALVARSVAGDEYAAFGAFWSLALIVGFGAFLPLELELARSLSSRPAAGPPARLKRTMAQLVLGCLVAIGITSPVLLPAIGNATLVPLVVLVAVSAGQFLLRGLLLGRGRLVTHGTLLLVDSGLRVVLALLVGLLLPDAGQVAYAWTTVAAAALAHLPVLVLSLRGRRSLTTPDLARPAASGRSVDVTSATVEDRRSLGSAVAHLLVGTASAQVLLNSSPVLVSAVAGDGQARTAAAYVACFTLVRLPLFVAVPLQSALVPLFVAAARRGGPRAVRALVVRALAATVVVAAVGVALGGWAGPSLVELLFGPDYVLSGGTVAVMAGGAGLHVGLLVLSQVLVAEQLHRRVAVVWVSGVVVGLVLFLVVPDLVLRATLAFTVGTAAALLISAFVLLAGTTKNPSPAAQNG